jgi:hypothetical protein
MTESRAYHFAYGVMALLAVGVAAVFGLRWLTS